MKIAFLKPFKALTASFLAFLLVFYFADSLRAADKVSFGTNWVAQAEHGGYYQALATGIYERYGLEVTIRQGGPQVNHAALMASGKLDFYMGGNIFEQFNFTQSGVPVSTVAAIFQKEPQVLLAHPGSGISTFEDIKGQTVFLSQDARLTFFRWLHSVFGIEESQVRNYTFNPAPFLADPESLQQGYITSEPFAIIEQAGFEPIPLLMADAGYDSYSTTIFAQNRIIEEKPDVVQRFVDASIEGWVSYLYGDPKPGNALIKSENPEMSDAQLAYSIAAMLKYGIVDSGDSLELGIGAMTDARWSSFFSKAVSWGSYSADLDFKSGYTLEFVNKGVGLELKKKLIENN